MSEMEPPEFFDDGDPLDEAPAHWCGGDCEHTGGGIWVRSWNRPLPDGRLVEVLYDNAATGVGVTLFPDADGHTPTGNVGGVTAFYRDLSANLYSDMAYADAAKTLMELINLIVDGDVNGDAG